FFQAEDGIRDLIVTGVQTCALPISFFAWVGVRGMTWFLFGRFGAPAMIALLGRQAFAVQGGAGQGPAPQMADYWKGPIAALKAEIGRASCRERVEMSGGVGVVCKRI